MADEPSRIEKAYHEAGHGVIGVVSGLPVTRCSISPEPLCELDENYVADSIEEKDRFSRFLLAGMTAQFRFHRVGSRPWHCGADDEQVDALGIQQRLEWLREDVVDMVEQHAESIRRVAQELLRVDELSGEQIQQIIGHPRSIGAGV